MIRAAGKIRAVGKWPAEATVQSLAKAGHLSTATTPHKLPEWCNRNYPPPAIELGFGGSRPG
jgi:hypothetical protein